MVLIMEVVHRRRNNCQYWAITQYYATDVCPKYVPAVTTLQRHTSDLLYIELKFKQKRCVTSEVFVNYSKTFA